MRKPLECIADRMVFARPLFVLLVMAVCSSCSAVELAGGREGIDVSPVGVGAKRADIESAFGNPLREWESENGISFALYEFEKGVPGSGGGAAAMVLMDVATAGVWELFWLGFDKDTRHGPPIIGRVVVSYDHSDVVLGLFNEFDELPPDGRSLGTPKVLQSLP